MPENAARPVILVNLPRDLGDGLFCAPALKKIADFAEERGMEIVTVGAKHRHGWAETMGGIALPFHDTAAAPLPPQTLARAIMGFNFDFYEHSFCDTYPSVPVYQPEKMEVVEKDTPQFGAGAVVGKKHIFDLLSDCLRDAGVLKTGEKLPLPAMPDALTSDAAVRDTQKKFGLEDGEKYAIFVPVCAANRPFKRWQIEKFAEVAGHYEAQGITPVIIGGPAEAEKQTCADLAARIGSTAKNICGQTSLGDIAALARGAQFTLGNDTGPTHIAAAGGTPVYTLYGYYNDPATWQSLTSGHTAKPLVGAKIQDIAALDAIAVIDAARSAAPRIAPAPQAPR